MNRPRLAEQLSELAKWWANRDRARSESYQAELATLMPQLREQDPAAWITATIDLAVLHQSDGQAEQSLAYFQAAAEAITELEGVIALRQDMDGPAGSGALGLNYKNLATLLHTEGRLDEALPAVLQARHLIEQYYPADSACQATHYFTEGLILLDDGRADAAIAPLMKTLTLLEPIFGDSYYQVLVTRCTLAEARRQTGELEAARSLAQRALDGLRNSPGNNAFYEERCAATVGNLATSR